MPNLPLQYVTDKDGNKVWPITHIKAVRDDNGTSLSWLLASKVNTPSWRPVKVDNVEVLGTETTTNPLNLKAGEGISLDASNGNIEIALSGSGGGVVLQQDDNTDAERPIIIKYGTGTADVTERVLTCDGITVNPSSNSLSISGNLSVTGDASFGNNVTIEGYSAVHEGNTDNYVPKWFTGTAITGTGASISAVIANSKAGDMYLNTSTDNVYKSSSVNVWGYFCNIKGNTGATGATGATGPQGPQGPQGPAGSPYFRYGDNGHTDSVRINPAGQYVRVLSEGLGITDPAWTTSLILSNYQNRGCISFNVGEEIGIWFTGNYIGIRDQNPAYQLEVNGNIGATNYLTRSDRHLKSNVQSIDTQSLECLFNTSDKLLKKFTWKQTGKVSYGFIAQELEQWIPEAVNHDKVKNLKSVQYDVAYTKIMAAMIYKIKELESLIKEKKRELD